MAGTTCPAGNMSAGKNVLADPWVNYASPLLVRDGMNERNARVIQGAVDYAKNFR